MRLLMFLDPVIALFRRSGWVLLALVLLAGSAYAQMMTLGVGSGGAGGGGGACDASFSSVVLLVGNDNAANGTTIFTDQSNASRTVSIQAGSPAYSNTTAPSGMTTSIAFQTGFPSLTVPNGSWIQFGSGNFTIEAYFNVNVASGTQDMVDTIGSAGYDEFQFIASNAVESLAGVNQTAWDISGVTSATFTANTWNHAAFYRVGSNFYGALNGSVTSLGTNASALFATTNPLLLGVAGSYGQYFTGYMASVRITKGVARYGASNFTPPALPLPHC